MGRRKNKKGALPPPPPPGGNALPPPPLGAAPLPPISGAHPTPPPGAPPLPPPPGAAPLPPLPSPPPLSPPPASEATEDSGPPTPPPANENNSEKPDLPPPSPVKDADESIEDPEVDDESAYSKLYAKKSGKSLQQIYGHIDRIAKGEIGSLLDRYSDRFGHELDRDSIVMRKNERSELLSELRDSPVVELVNATVDEQEDDDDDDDVAGQLKIIEDELRRLKPEFQAAKESGDKDTMLEMRPILKELMAERKMLQNIISGQPADGEGAETETAPTIAQEDDDEDIFPIFVAIVDDLLGNHLPDDVVSEFMASEEFDIYREVGGDPSSASEEMRGQFFAIVDSRLGGMPDEAVKTFLASPEFGTYRAVGEIYS